MPDIIDNRTTKLAERIRHYLQLSRQAHFAVGYFYVGGFEAIAEAVPGLEKLRLLIGPSTNRATAEEITRGHKARSAIQQEWFGQTSIRPVDARAMREETLRDARETLERADQTDESQRAIAELSRLIAEGVIEVRVYTKEALHAKCYIFDERDAARAQTDPGHVIIGSSNLTVPGIESNTELNVVLQDPSVHEKVTEWFDNLWDAAHDFSEELLREVKTSWAVNDQVTPWDIYLKTLYTLFQDQLEAEAEPIEVIDESWPILADYQRKAYNYARARLEQYGGVLIADVVGLGKSYVGLALLKWGRLHGMRPMVICPAGLVPMWRGYSDQYDVGAMVVSTGLLTVEEDEDGERWSVLDDDLYDDCDLVLIDESHNFRYSNTQRYEAIDGFLSRGQRKVVMLTATPMAIGPGDIQNQLRLWPGNGRSIPTGQWSFDEFFKLAKKGEVDVPEVLRHVMIRRRRWDVADKWLLPDGSKCPEALDRKQKWQTCRPIIMIGDREHTFPRRVLQDPVRYRIDNAYQGLYATIRSLIDPEYGEIDCLPTRAILARVDAAREAAGEPELSREDRDALAAAISEGLTYARYGLYQYVKPQFTEKEPYLNLVAAGINLRGLMRILLFKRLESSVEAFRSTCQTLARTHEHFVTALDQGKIPAGQDMQRAIYDLGIEETSTSDVMEAIEQAERKSANKYDIKAFEADRLRADLQADARLFSALYYLVSEIGPNQDAKLQRLKKLLEEEIGEEQKVILFTQFEDTARYLYDQLGTADPEIEWISGSRDTASIIGRFAPRSNPGFARRAHGQAAIRVLISTDVLSEGQNLQDAHCVVNYDLHFNPVRLIQRFGRIDRLMPYFPEDEDRSPALVWAWNFFPETELDAHLELEEKVRRRVDEMRRVIGQDAPVLHPSEEIDEDGVIRLYSGDGTVAQEEEDDDLRSPLADAEQLIRDIQRNRPDEYERIGELPDGIRSARLLDHEKARFFVYCRAGDFHQLYLADADGEIVSSDLSEGLEAVECEEDEPREELPPDINAAVTKVKRHFDRIVKEMQARRHTRPKPSLGQRYAIDHLREQRMSADPDDRQRVFDPLIEAFQRPVSTAIRRRLNFFRREKLEGDALLRQLRRLYTEHRLYQANGTGNSNGSEHLTPRIVCSEGLGGGEGCKRG